MYEQTITPRGDLWPLFVGETSDIFVVEMTNERSSLRRCIEELSAKNTDYRYPEQAINQAESLKSLSSDLYTDNIRFIYELIQNADDAKAENVTLAVREEKFLIITHNGRQSFFFHRTFSFSYEENYDEIDRLFYLHLVV